MYDRTAKVKDFSKKAIAIKNLKESRGLKTMFFNTQNQKAPLVWFLRF